MPTRTHRPTADELLRHPFFTKAKSREFLVSQLIAQLPPLGQRINQKPPAGRKPGASGKFKKVHGDDGEVGWEWEDDDSTAGSAHPGVKELAFKLR